MRGTPVLVLVLASYVSAAIGLDLGPFAAGVLALVFCSSHVGEIVRGALQAIPGARPKPQGHRPELRPDLLVGAGRRRCAKLPAWVNTAAEMVKASTLLSVIGVAELLLRTQEIISRNFMSLQFYFLAGGLYFIVNFGIERLGKLRTQEIISRNFMSLQFYFRPEACTSS